MFDCASADWRSKEHERMKNEKRFSKVKLIFKTHSHSLEIK